MPTGLILQPTYQIRDQRPVVQLFGRLDDGPPFLIEDDRFRPYLFVRSARRRGARAGSGHDGRGARPARPRRPAGGEGGLPLPSAVSTLRDRLARAGVADLRGRRPLRLSLPDRPRHPRAWRRSRGRRRSARAACCCSATRCSSRRPARPALRVLSLDIETTPDASRDVLARARGLRHARRCTWSRRGRCTARGVMPTSARCSARCWRACARSTRTCCSAGTWSTSICACSRVAVRRCASRARSAASRAASASSRTAPSRARGGPRSPGRMVLDGVGLVRDAMRLEDYRLETVARAVLGRGKRIDADAPDAAAEIARLFRDDPEALAAYNLEDARLALEIVEQGGPARPDARAQPAVGHAARPRRREHRVLRPDLPARAAPARHRRAERGRRPAGRAWCRAARCSTRCPGLFRNVAVFDFKSLYPSLIRTFNLDPLAHARAPRAPASPRSRRRTGRASRATTPSCRRCSTASWRAARSPSSAATGTPTRRSRS